MIWICPPKTTPQSKFKPEQPLYNKGWSTIVAKMCQWIKSPLPPTLPPTATTSQKQIEFKLQISTRTQQPLYHKIEPTTTVLLSAHLNQLVATITCWFRITMETLRSILGRVWPISSSLLTQKHYNITACISTTTPSFRWSRFRAPSSNDTRKRLTTKRGEKLQNNYTLTTFGGISKRQTTLKEGSSRASSCKISAPNTPATSFRAQFQRHSTVYLL